MTHMSVQNFTRLKLSTLLNLEPFNVNWLKIWQTWSTNQTPCTVLPPISVIFCKFSRNLERKALHLYSTIFSVYYRRIFSWVSQFLDGRDTLIGVSERDINTAFIKHQWHHGGPHLVDMHDLPHLFIVYLICT